MEILDSAGTVIRKYAPDTAAAAPAAGAATGGGRGRGGFNVAPPMTVGVNHANWDLRYTPAVSFPGMILWGGSTNGPSATPGAYKVRLTVDGKSQTQPLTVKRNPAFDDVSDADLKAQFALAIKLRDKVSEANQAIIDIRNVRLQIADRLTKSQDGKTQGSSRPRCGALQGCRRRCVSSAESEWAGSAELPDQDQQSSGVAVERRCQWRWPSHWQCGADFQRSFSGIKNSNGCADKSLENRPRRAQCRAHAFGSHRGESKMRGCAGVHVHPLIHSRYSPAG